MKSQKEEKYQYTSIPLWLTPIKEISPNAKMLAGIIYALDNDKGCYALNKTLGKYLQVGGQQISNWIAELINFGIVKTNRKRGYKRVLNIVDKENYFKIKPPGYISNGYKGYISNGYNTYIKKDNKENNNTKVLLNKASLKLTSVIKIPKAKINLIELWNKYPQTPNHRTGTKLHKTIVRYTNQLLKGTFGNHNTISKEFLEVNDLPNDAPHQQFSIRQIKQALKELSKLYQNGMDKDDKDWLKGMNLSTLIYNPRSRKSQLLKYLFYDVKPTNERNNYAKQPANEDWIKQIKPLINEKGLTPTARITFRNNLILIDRYYDWIWKYPLNESKTLKNKLEDENIFFDWYEKWLSKKRKVNPGGIGPKSKDWKLFLSWLSEDCLGSDVSLNDYDYDKQYMEI